MSLIKKSALIYLAIARSYVIPQQQKDIQKEIENPVTTPSNQDVSSSEPPKLSNITLVILTGILLILFIGMAVFLASRLRKGRAKTLETDPTDTHVGAKDFEYEEFRNDVLGSD